MSFKTEPGAIAALKREPEMARFLASVASEMSTAIEARAPAWIKLRDAEFSSGVRSGSDGPEGFADVKSPFWHLDEYGSIKNPVKPYIRPAAIAVLAKRGGRLGEES